ncbi:MAG: galactose-1-epimerase [Verrucomicrobiota bacterium]
MGSQKNMEWLIYAFGTVVFWGIYGILLHTGSMAMGDSVNGRYKAFLFVGIAYFIAAVLAPLILLKLNGASWNFPAKGVSWSLIAGIAGALGAFFVLLAFGAKGSPAVVMSIIFAGAPIVNAVVALSLHPPVGGFSVIKWPFYLGIILAAVGGCLVTLYKPGPGSPPSANKTDSKQEQNISSETTKKLGSCSVEQTYYGRTKTGQELQQFILKNDSGMEVRIIELGAIITNWLAPDAEGKLDDIVLGFDQLADYENNEPHFGEVVGRYANRIAKGQFKLGGKIYKLTKNHGNHHIHGGLDGFGKRIWQGASFKNEDRVGVVFKMTSPDKDQGYPGELKTQVTYTLDKEGQLRIDYTAESSKRTVVNLTQHAYFNLMGHGSGDILDHQVMIAAETFTTVKKGLIPTGKLADVEKTPMDFRTLKPICSDLKEDFGQLNMAGGYDHNFVLSEQSSGMKLAAKVIEPGSKRLLEVWTDQPGLQFYTGNALDGSIKGKGGFNYQKHAGFCLESQHFPDSPNHKDFPSTVLRAGEIYQTSTAFRMSTVA